MLGNSEITDETWDDVEALLIQADMGVPTTQRVVREFERNGYLVWRQDLLGNQGCHRLRYIQEIHRGN